MRIALITIVHGRHAHLRNQSIALLRSDRAPDHHVVVAMDDRAVSAQVPGAELVEVGRRSGSLPLAAARNAGVERAKQLGTDLLVLLDVDCIPSPALLHRYAAAATARDGVFCGPVGYLPPAGPEGYPVDGLRELARPHPARPVPDEGAVDAATDPNLFWSLSFAVRPAVWDRIGGFCEDFYGYGGEDTDFGHAAAAAGIPMWWVGGAWAFHQYHGAAPHASVGPPVDHIDDVLRNAGVFYIRWGWWPMLGWLEEFRRLGLARVAPDTGMWERTQVREPI